MSAMLKAWLIFFVAAPLLHMSWTIKTGEFYVVVESVDNHPEMSRDVVDWHFSLRRINKTVKVIDGHFTLKTPIARPRVQGETYMFTMNKFVKININGPMQSNCKDLTESFLDHYFEGNVTWSDDCVLQPGYMETRKDTPINMDEIAHKIYSKTFYKTFNMIATVYSEDNNPIMKVSWVLSTKEKE